MMGGGVKLGEITEFCGSPGVGKTQLCMQCCLDVQIPAEFGGVGGNALYIDAEGSLSIERLNDMASSVSVHLQHLGRSKSPQISPKIIDFTVSKLLEGIQIIRIHDINEQISVLHSLDRILDQNPLIKLVVIDSMAFLLRPSSKSSQLLLSLGGVLNGVARDRFVSIIVTNHVSARSSESSSSSSSCLVPSLGETWGHIISTRMILSINNGNRSAVIAKSPSVPSYQKSAEFVVSQAGIRDSDNQSLKRKAETGDNDSTRRVSARESLFVPTKQIL